MEKTGNGIDELSLPILTNGLANQYGQKVVAKLTQCLNI